MTQLHLVESRSHTYRRRLVLYLLGKSCQEKNYDYVSVVSCFTSLFAHATEPTLQNSIISTISPGKDSHQFPPSTFPPSFLPP